MSSSNSSTTNSNIIRTHTKYGVLSLYANETYITPTFVAGNYWDEATLLELKKYIDPTKNIIEIGAHCGTSSIVYASFLSPGAKIYAFEPQYNLYLLLCKNIVQNGFNNCIIPYNVGLFNYIGEATMNAVDIDGGGGTVAERYTTEQNLPCNFGGICLGTGGETIRVQTLDLLSEQCSPVGFIHCDAQGAEKYIFSCGTQLIAKHRPVILFENNASYQQSKYLSDTVSAAYSDISFNLINYCVENLNYRVIRSFNKGCDDLLIPIPAAVPKTIHLVHKSYKYLERSYNAWSKLNPEYQLELYNNHRCRQILAEYGQKYVDIFDFIPDGPIKCDFARLCILYLHGGIYVDSDVEPLIPLYEYVSDDLDFATCISYNYVKRKQTWNYNPQFILAKKYDTYIASIINKYIALYDAATLPPVYGEPLTMPAAYNYWQWSICAQMHTFHDVENTTITVDGDNTFIDYASNNPNYPKKTRLYVEQFNNDLTGELYNFTNFNYENYHIQYPGPSGAATVFCTYQGKRIFYNNTLRETY